jgi:two-component system, OmpR family, KDP operon response regulator KdpE
MTGGPLVLVIEDEVQIRRFLRMALASAGFRMTETALGVEGLDIIAGQQPNVVILDLGLPDLDGVEVVKRLREWSSIPVIVLSARTQEDDKIAALDAGADDYLTKPFGVGELLARLRVAIRHAAQANTENAGGAFTLGDLRVDLVHRHVYAGAQEVHLTPKEYRLLATFIKHAGKVLTHRQLLKEVWGPQYVNETHYLRIYMAQLRHKLERDPTRPQYLITEAGVGYRLLDDGIGAHSP